MTIVGTALTGALSNVISGTGTWLVRSAVARRGRPSEHDRAIAAWFDEYELSQGLLEAVPLPHDITEGQAAVWLASHETRAILHELIAVELTDAPSTVMDRVRDNLRFSCLDTFPDVNWESVGQFSDAVFAVADFELKQVAGRLASGDQEFWSRVREEALSGRLAALLELTVRHTNSQSSLTASDRVRDRQYISRYQQVAASEHGFLEPPDFEQRRRVSIGDLYVAPDISQDPDEDKPRAPSRRVTIWQFAAEADRSVLLGDPGGGKSTAINVLMHLLSSEHTARVPLLVILREYAKEDPPAQSIVGYLESRLEAHYQCPAPPGLVERLLLSGKAAVFFDGLDELIDTARRREVTQRVENFSKYYPLTPVIVTSRRIGYAQARLDPEQFSTFQLASFTDAQTEEYAAKWFAQERRLGDQEPEHWAASFARESETIPDLRSNPLMLALLCILYRGEGSLPRNRPAVYERCSTLLFETWDTSRSILVNLRARDLIEPVLRHLAHWLLVRNLASPVVTEAQLIQETARYLQDRRYEDIAEATRAAQEFVDFCKGRAWVFAEVGTSADGEPLFTFSHRTFLEYFAAAYLASICDSPERLASALAPHIARQEWDVVAELALQIKSRQIQDGGSRFYSALLSSRKYSAAGSVANLASFLARCLSFIDVPPTIVRKVADRCLELLLPAPLQSERVTPLGWLMTVERVRDIVSTYLDERISTLVEQDNSSNTITALHLTLALGNPVYSVNESIDSMRLQEYSRYWFGHGTILADRYRGAILSHALDDPSLLLISYIRNWISLREFGNWPEKPWKFLFEDHVSVGVGTGYWMDPVSMLTRSFAAGSPVADEHVGQLEEVLDLIKALGPPPWVVNESIRLTLTAIGETVSSVRPPSEAAWTSALLLAATLSEGSHVREKDLGILACLAPYIRHRQESIKGQPFSEELEPLNVEDGFQEMFNEWAAGTLSFRITTRA